jgi:RIO-like serine/threonine protein kinase
MHSIGNEHDALTILHWVRSHPKEYGRPKCVIRGEAPLGWEYIGRGAYRSVWRSPEGVAYKVGHYDTDYQSAEEVDKLSQAWKKGPVEGCRLPKFTPYYPDDDIVVAVELIEGETLYEYGESSGPFGDYYEILSDIEDAYRLGDMHDQNAIVDQDGFLVPVDFGG